MRWRRSGWRFLEGRQFVFEADIRDFFGSIDHDRLMVVVEQRVSDRRVLKLMRSWLRAGVLTSEGKCRAGGRWHSSGWGDLAVVGQHLPARVRPGLGRAGHRRVGPLRGRLRGVVSDPRDRPRRPRRRATALLGELGLELHPDKTRVVDLREGREGFDFLGCHLRARMSGRLWEQQRIVRYYLHRWPSAAGDEERPGHGSRHLTGRNRVGIELKDIIGALNLFLRGWGNYFRTGNAADKFRQLDRYVGVAAQTLADQAAGPQPTSRAGGTLDPKPGSTTRDCTS